MKLAMRVKALGKQLTLLTSAFVLAVSGIVAAGPFGLAQVVSALEIVDGGGTAKVYNAADLAEAAANTAIKNISIKASFTTSDKTVLTGRNVNIDGNGNTITFAGLPGWQSEYVFQAYKISLSVKNITITGGDAALYANGSTVSLQGAVNVSGNEFGGIEVSQGVGVTTAAKLTVAGTLANTSESNTKPTVWTDHASTANATVSGPFTKTTHIGPDQTQYYLVADNAGIVATNVTTGATYATVQAALAAASAGDTVRLDADVTLASTGYPTLRINKAITFDGNGKTITAPFTRGTVGGENNTALAVVVDGVTVKNLTTNSTAANPAHGIVVQGIGAISGVTLQNVATNGATAGVILNNSTVTIDGISTAGSAWYGIGVDKGAQLTIQGTTSHTEAQAIKNDNTATSSVTDAAGQYVKYTITGDTKAYYVKGEHKLLSPADGAFVKGDSLTNAWTAVPGATSYVYESWNDAGATSLRHRGTYTTTSKTATNVSETVFYWRVKAIDAAGNETAFTPLWKVTVDNTAPSNATFTYSNGNGATLTKENVVVTMTTNEPVQTPTDWTEVSPTVFERTYSKNGKFQVVLTDLAGNVSTPQKYEVKRIDKIAPEVTGVTDGATVRGNVTLTIVDPKRDGYDGGFNKDTGLEVNGAPVVTTVAGSAYQYTISGNGTYTIVATDKAGNKTTLTFTIDNSVSTTINPIAGDTATPTVSGIVAYNADGARLANANIVVTVDGANYMAMTDADGTWSVPVTVANGPHSVVVSLVDSNDVATAVGSTSFTTAITEGEGGNQGGSQRPGGETRGSGNDDATAAAAFAGPLAINPAGVLGASDNSTTDTNGADVKGTSTEKTLAEAVDANNTDGTALGLAWYWWLLIAAGAATLVWWIVAAIRRRQAEA